MPAWYNGPDPLNLGGNNNDSDDSDDDSGGNGGPFLGHSDPVTALVDIPADAVNASTGTGKNLGFFGKVDRTLDPRASEVGPGKDTFVPPDSEKKETQGLGAGLKAGLGATGATAGKGAATVVSGVVSGLVPQLLKSPALLALVAGAVLWLLRPVLGLAE